MPINVEIIFFNKGKTFKSGKLFDHLIISWKVYWFKSIPSNLNESPYFEYIRVLKLIPMVVNK